MSINHFIPQIWAASILRANRKALVYNQPGVVNRDYEGDISAFGDTVNINSIGDPTISDYTKNVDMSGPETLTDAQRQLVIDAAKSFNFQVDNIDKRQGMPGVMDEATARAGYRLADAADQYTAAKMVAGATLTIGNSTTPIVIDNSGAYAYDQLIKAKVALDEENAPTEGRFAIVPSWFEAALGLDPRFVGTRGYDQNSVLLNGAAGRAAGFNILVSPNVPSTAGSPPVKYKIVAGVGSAYTFADQLNQVKAYEPEKRFADALKGLHLYGGKVIRGYELVVLTANDGLGLAGSGVQDPTA